MPAPPDPGATVFGSAAWDDPAARDLDIAVLLERGAEIHYLGLIDDLQRVTEANIDVVHLNPAGPVLRERALVGSVVLDESEPGAWATASTAAVLERMDTVTPRRLDVATLRGFLPEVDEPWAGERRRELAHGHRRALACYAEACLQLGPGELASAERSARALVALDPHSEVGYRLLMRALDQRGDRAAALMVYDELCRILRDDLGIVPGPASRALHGCLLRDRP